MARLVKIAREAMCPGRRARAPGSISSSGTVCRWRHSARARWASCTVWLRGYDYEYIAAEKVQAWLNDLETVANIAESLPRPTITDRATDIEIAEHAIARRMQRTVRLSFKLHIGELLVAGTVMCGIAAWLILAR